MQGMSVRVASCDGRASALLDRGATWSLAACFERALILESSSDGALISVVRHDVPDGPFTVRLDRSSPADMRVFDGPPDLLRDSAARWVCPPISPDDAVAYDELGRRFGVLDLIASRAGGSRIGWDTAIPKREIAALELALVAGDAQEASGVAARIAGLGPGLTPSGDDVLAGALATHAWAEGAGHVADGGAMRLAISSAASARTTRLGSQLIVAAAAGEVAMPLARILVSLFQRVGTFPPDLAPLLAVGETSGADLLAGVLLAGRALRAPTAVGSVA